MRPRWLWLGSVFVLGAGSQVFAMKFDALGNPITTYFLVTPGAVQMAALSSDAGRHPQLFVHGPDNQIFSRDFSELALFLSQYEERLSNFTHEQSPGALSGQQLAVAFQA